MTQEKTVVINLDLHKASVAEVARAFDVSIEEAYLILTPWHESRDLVERPRPAAWALTRASEVFADLRTSLGRHGHVRLTRRLLRVMTWTLLVGSLGVPAVIQLRTLTSRRRAPTEAEGGHVQ